MKYFTSTLEKNILNMHAHSGQEWLASLPDLVENLSKQWQLKNIKSVENMNWNFVALAMKHDQHVVLKISCNKQLLQDEYNALKHFAGNGAIKALAIDTQYNALLLEQAIPGLTLKENHTLTIDEKIHTYVAIVKKLIPNKPSNNNFTTAQTWCTAIDRIDSSQISKHLIEKANLVRSKLFASSQRQYVCHGDLHLENIIQNQSEWLAIDPKGVIGETAFEAAAFDLLDEKEWQDTSTALDKLSKRILTLAQGLDISFDRLLAWIFLRIMISAQWFIEDKGDPSKMLILAGYTNSLLKMDSHFNFV